MSIRNILLSIVVLLSLSGRAVAIPSIRLTASRLAALNDGRDSTEVIAEVFDGPGPAPDGTTVTFTTNVGVFAQAGSTATAQTRAGSARVRLSSQQKGTAMVQAVSGGGGFASIEITFTDDPAETFQGNAFIAVQASGSLLYSASDRVIEASARAGQDPERKLPGASLVYRNIELFADTLQMDCTANVVRAYGSVTLRKGSHRLACARLYLPLMGGDGYAIAEVERRLRPVRVKGKDLALESLQDGVSSRFFAMTDLSEAQLVIAARQILLFPGDKLQFKRPRFYQNGQQLLAMPFYSLALYSSQLFTDQFLSVGTEGLGVDVPLYYDMSPSTTGVFRIRHGERAGRSVYATRPGWSLDMAQTYTAAGGSRRLMGEFGFTGLNRSDWGFRWNHSQEFSPDTRGSFFLDLPQHRNLYLSTNLSRQMGMFYLGMNLSANRSLSGILTQGGQGDLYLETVARKVGGTGYMMAFGGTASVTRAVTGDYRTSAVTQGVQTRFYSRPFKLDRDTTLTHYFTVGQLWTSLGRSGSSILSTLTATRSFRGGANLQLSYDFTRQPNLLPDLGSHRVSMNFMASGAGKWSLFLYGSTLLDAANSSFVGDFSYAFARRWSFTLSATLQRFSATGYRDFEIGLARSLGGRDLVLSYSTLSHRFFFDIEASRF